MSYDQNISAPIEDWTADRAMRSKGVHPFNAGDRIAKARLVMVGYDRDKEDGIGIPDLEFRIVAPYTEGHKIGAGLNAEKVKARKRSEANIA